MMAPSMIAYSKSGSPDKLLKTRSNTPFKADRRMTVEEMLAVGSEIAPMPLLDQRSPREIMDDLNAL